jgi:hypothetical protein
MIRGRRGNRLSAKIGLSATVLIFAYICRFVLHREVCVHLAGRRDHGVSISFTCRKASFLSLFFIIQLKLDPQFRLFFSLDLSKNCRFLGAQPEADYVSLKYCVVALDFHFGTFLPLAVSI